MCQVDRCDERGMWNRDVHDGRATSCQCAERLSNARRIVIQRIAEDCARGTPRRNDSTGAGVSGWLGRARAASVQHVPRIGDAGSQWTNVIDGSRERNDAVRRQFVSIRA